MTFSRLGLAGALLFFVLTPSNFALDADDLHELLGYTMVAHSNVSGDFEGADFDKLVKFDNGMVFEFSEYSYNYSFRPAVAVFAMELKGDVKTPGLKPSSGRRLVVYKLVIDDEIYDAIRVR